MRPLFPEGYLNETQIIAMVLSADPEHDPGILAIVGAGAALAISDIPFHHLVSAVRVGMIDGKYVANPTYAETRASKLNIIVAGSDQGHRHGRSRRPAGFRRGSSRRSGIRPRILQEDHRRSEAAGEGRGQTEERVQGAGTRCNELVASIDKKIRAELTDALNTKKYEKLESYARVDALHDRVVEEAADEQKAEANKVFKHLKERIFRDEMLEARIAVPMAASSTKSATSGAKPAFCRAPTVRRSLPAAKRRRWSPSLWAPRTTNSASKCSKPGETFKRFMLHYNFPPFSVGEVGFHARTGPSRNRPRRSRRTRRQRGDSRSKRSSPTRSASSATFWNRTVRAPWPPFAARVSRLMDAGVPITAPVGGVAMGLVKEGDKYAILTDIAGAEDHYGDMDFKVAGTKDGITALQMDIKVAERDHHSDEGSARTGAPRPSAHPGRNGQGTRCDARARCRRTRLASTR